jgi:uncharacterized protein YdcH (DUF465 family)
MDNRDKNIADLQEKRDAVDAMIAAVEQNSEPFENVEERWMRRAVAQVLEDLKALRDGLEEEPERAERYPRERAERYPRAPGPANVRKQRD